jgi:hypothetical protein
LAIFTSPSTLRALAFRASSGAAGTTTWPLRAVFIGRDFAVAVLVKLLQRLAGLGELGGVNDSVPIEIKRGNDGMHGTLSRWSPECTWPARTTFATGRALPFSGLFFVLRSEQARRGSERQREHDTFVFHNVYGVDCRLPSPAVCIDKMQ